MDDQPATAQPAKTQTLGDREYRLKVYDRYLATASAVGLIVSTLFALVNYSNQRAKELELRDRELQLLIYQEKKEVLYPLCEAAAAIVSCQSPDDALPHTRDFLTLYYGKAHLLFSVLRDF